MQNSFTSPSGFVCVSYPDTRPPRPRAPVRSYETKPIYTAQSLTEFRMSWLPTYPTRLVKLRPVYPGRIGVFGGAIFQPALAPIGWAPRYPTYWPARRLHRTFSAFDFDALAGADIRTAQQMAWDPRQHPIVVRPKISRSQFAYVPPSAVIATGIGCAEMINAQGATPTLLTPTATVPTLIDQTASAPTLINEDFC